MSLLSRYIARQVIAAVALALLVLVGLDVIAELFDEAGNQHGAYDFVEVLLYVGLTVPRRIHEYLPFAALIGCLAGLGTLANRSELTVMRAAGVSAGRIAWYVMQPTLAIVLLGLLLNQYLAPAAEQYADSRRALLRGGGEPVLSKEGLWHRERHAFMHFNVVQPGGVLYGVKIFQFDAAGELTRALYARRADWRSGGRWQLADVRMTLFAGDRTYVRHLATLDWATDMHPELLSLAVMNPKYLSISRLWRYAQYRERQGLDAKPLLLAFWGKVTQPLGTLSLVLVAISFVFGPLRQVTMGYRLFSGVLVGIAFRTGQQLLGPASIVFDFAPLYAVLAPIVLTGVIGLYVLRRV